MRTTFFKFAFNRCGLLEPGCARQALVRYEMDGGRLAPHQKPRQHNRAGRGEGGQVATLLPCCHLLGRGEGEQIKNTRIVAVVVVVVVVVLQWGGDV